MGWLMVDRIVRMGMGLFVGVWVARYLGPIQFGSLNFAVAFVALFGSVTTLGLDGIVMREVLHNHKGTPEILGTTFALRSIGGLLAVGVSIVTLRVIQPNDRQALLLVAILSLTLVFQAFDTIDVFFQSQVQSKITVWAKNGAFLVFALIRVSLIYVKASLWEFAAAMTGEIALGAAGLVLGYRLSGGRMLSWRSSKMKAVHLLEQSWPIIFSSMAIMVYMRLDMVMLKMMQGDFAVGLYAAATRISEVWYFIPVAVVSSVSPAIMRAKDDPELFYGRLRRLFSLMTAISLRHWFGCGVGIAGYYPNTVLEQLSRRGAGAYGPHLGLGFRLPRNRPVPLEHIEEPVEVVSLLDRSRRDNQHCDEPLLDSKVFCHGSSHRHRRLVCCCRGVCQYTQRANKANLLHADEVLYSASLLALAQWTASMHISARYWCLSIQCDEVSGQAHVHE